MPGFYGDTSVGRPAEMDPTYYMKLGQDIPGVHQRAAAAAASNPINGGWSGVNHADYQGMARAHLQRQGDAAFPTLTPYERATMHPETVARWDQAGAAARTRLAGGPQAPKPMLAPGQMPVMPQMAMPSPNIPNVMPPRPNVPNMAGGPWKQQAPPLAANPTPFDQRHPGLAVPPTNFNQESQARTDRMNTLPRFAGSPLGTASPRGPVASVGSAPLSVGSAPHPAQGGFDALGQATYDAVSQRHGSALGQLAAIEQMQSQQGEQVRNDSLASETALRRHQMSPEFERRQFIMGLAGIDPSLIGNMGRAGPAMEVAGYPLAFGQPGGGMAAGGAVNPMAPPPSQVPAQPAGSWQQQGTLARYPAMQQLLDQSSVDGNVDNFAAGVKVHYPDFSKIPLDLRGAMASQLQGNLGQAYPKAATPITPGSWTSYAGHPVARRIGNFFTGGNFGEMSPFSDPVEESQKRQGAISLLQAIDPSSFPARPQQPAPRPQSAGGYRGKMPGMGTMFFGNLFQ